MQDIRVWIWGDEATVAGADTTGMMQMTATPGAIRVPACPATMLGREI